MTNSKIANRRLYNQGITGSKFQKPAEVVQRLGAIQAQDYLGSLWSVGLRVPGATEAAIEQAIAARELIRTWPMRGTIHYVAPEDVRWMLELMTPRIVSTHTERLRRDYELDTSVCSQSRECLVKALQGSQRLTREGTYQVLEAGGISTTGQRGLHILWRLAQEGLICFGPREGKQPTFVLLDEWVPNAKRLAREEALAEIARRYFTGHGPATLSDFAWWTGLNVAEARAGLEMVKSELVEEVIDGQHYWSAGPVSGQAEEETALVAYLLPVYDEYTVAYKDRSAVLEPQYTQEAGYGLSSCIIMNGEVVGTWKRVLNKQEVLITSQPFRPFTAAEKEAYAQAADDYAKFLGKIAILA